MAIFCATMPPKAFHTFSRMQQFDNRESRPARRVRDKLAAIRGLGEVGGVSVMPLQPWA